jgi:FtsH-binding integral membrane protein
MVFWMLSIAFSVVFLAVSAAARASDPSMAYVHMAIAALMPIVFALICVRDTRLLIRSGAPRNAIYASTTRFMGLVWAWAALALVITYGTGVLEWRNWWVFFIVSIVVAGLFLFLSQIIRQDLARGEQDDKILQFGGYIIIAQLAGMVAVIVALFVNRHDLFSFASTDSWAANLVFLFGALALAATCAYSLKAAIGDAK